MQLSPISTHLDSFSSNQASQYKESRFHALERFRKWITVNTIIVVSFHLRRQEGGKGILYVVAFSNMER